MLGQATGDPAVFPRQGVPEERQLAEARRASARRKLESRIGGDAGVLFDSRGKVRRVARGQPLARSDGYGDAVYIVLDGVVGLYGKPSASGPDVLGYCYAGDMIAPARFGAAWGFDAKALTGGELLELSLKDIRTERDGVLLWPLFETACAELSRRIARLRGYWFLPVKARLAMFLFEMDEGIGRKSDRGLVVDLPMYRDEIATYLGTRTETICRILTAWKESGLIVMDSPRRLVIPDGDGLRADAFA